jgi:hypothetical protein
MHPPLLKSSQYDTYAIASARPQGQRQCRPGGGTYMCDCYITIALPQAATMSIMTSHHGAPSCVHVARTHVHHSTIVVLAQLQRVSEMQHAAAFRSRHFPSFP